MQSEGIKKNQSLGKALKILEIMANLRTPVRLQDLARQLSLPSSTVLRFLNSFIENGYITKEAETSRYHLTLKLVQISSKIQAYFPYREALSPYLRKISMEIHESASLCIEQDGNVVYIDVKEGPDHMLQTLQRIGRIAPLYNTGAGKILLLNYSREEFNNFFSARPFKSYTEHTITTKEVLLEELSEVRKNGYAFDNEECEIGVSCIAGPIRDFTGNIVAAYSVSMPTSRMIKKKVDCIRILIHYCNEASRSLGWEN